MRKLLIIGNSTSSELMYEYLWNDSRYQIEAFSVDAQFIKQEILFERPVVDLKNLADTVYDTYKNSKKP